MVKPIWPVITLSMALFTLSCANKTDMNQNIVLNYQSYTLDNGLKVILHEDHSDPVVALAIQYHAGSGREKPGKTGFAHFFEHMLFQRSENLPRNAFFKNISSLGGDFNGSTNTDGTNYFESVPKDALEKILWMESDRMGFFINTVTRGGLEREIDIVSNEKRQNYDNQPYGHSSSIIAQELFPEGHPYSWTTIGDLDDLRSATLEDVKDFYHRFYTPGNATLALTGDFNPVLAKELINKYFGEIKKGVEVKKPEIRPLKLHANKKIVWEDKKAPMPELTLIFPGVEAYNRDAYALQYFASLFANSKKSPLYKVVVEEKKLAPDVKAFNIAREVSGYLQINIRTFPGVDLNDLMGAVNEAFDRFEKEGIDEIELQKQKVMQEVGLYNRMTSVLGKALMIARDNEFGGSPETSLKDLDKYRTLTAQDIISVYDKYVKNRPSFCLSIIPSGGSVLALKGSTPARIKEERVEEQKMNSGGGKIADEDYSRTPSLFDRSVEPGFLPDKPEVKVPDVWNFTLSNGMKVYGITRGELPLIQVEIEISGGKLLDPPGKKGLCYLNAQLMNEGTAARPPQELESSLALLGARVRVNSSAEKTNISISSLSGNFGKVMELVREMIVSPRFDTAGLEKSKQKIGTLIRQNSVNPSAIANNIAMRAIFGEESPFATEDYGTAETVAAITMEDIKSFYNSSISPSIASFNIAGAIDSRECRALLSSLEKEWKAKKVIIPDPVRGTPFKAKTVYFADYPGAQQSVINVCKAGVAVNDPDYYPAIIVNQNLGGGSQGILFDVLRLQRGYTYGAYSWFSGGNHLNTFIASSSVQGSATGESLRIFRELIENWEESFDESVLESTKNSMLRANASAFETLGDLVDMLCHISGYNLPFDYVKKEEEILKKITVSQGKELIKKVLNPSELCYIVVGNAKSQMVPLENLGMGKPVVIKR